MATQPNSLLLTPPPLPSLGPVTIQRLVAGGLGMGFADGYTLFIPYTAPGDVVRPVVRHQRKRTLSADIGELLQPGLGREAACCPYYTHCGGCQLQHLNAETVLQVKQAMVADALSHIGRLPEIPVLPTLAPQQRLGYRCRAGIKIRQVAGQTLAGFFAANSQRVIDLANCPVLDPLLQSLLSALRQTVATLSVADQLPQCDICRGDGQAAMLVHLLSPLTRRDRERLLALAEEQDLASLWLRQGEVLTPLVQRAALDYTVAGMRLSFQPGAFTQANRVMNQQLVAEALEQAGHGGLALDLFCGMGNFTLPLARQFQEVLGVEVAAGAVRQGVLNGAQNQLPQVCFQQGDLFAPAAVARLPLDQADLVLLDPPRDGAVVLAKRLAATPPKRIVYVSCNPASFARDAAILVHGGLRLVRVQPVEMFPHSSHVELVATFTQ